MISKMKRRSRARSGRALSALDLNPSLAPYPANEIPHSVRSSHCWDLKYNHCIIGDKKIDWPSLHARQFSNSKSENKIEFFRMQTLL